MITFNGEKMKHRYQSYANWTSVPVPRTSSLRAVWTELDVGFIPPKKVALYEDCNEEYFGRDFFVGLNFWSRLSFQISEFRISYLAFREWP